MCDTPYIEPITKRMVTVPLFPVSNKLRVSPLRSLPTPPGSHGRHPRSTQHPGIWLSFSCLPFHFPVSSLFWMAFPYSYEWYFSLSFNDHSSTSDGPHVTDPCLVVPADVLLIQAHPNLLLRLRLREVDPSHSLQASPSLIIHSVFWYTFMCPCNH